MSSRPIHLGRFDCSDVDVVYRPSTLRRNSLRSTPTTFSAEHTYTPASSRRAEPSCSTRSPFVRLRPRPAADTRTPSCVHVIAGGGAPLTSHVIVTARPSVTVSSVSDRPDEIFGATVCSQHHSGCLLMINIVRVSYHHII